MGVLHRGSHPMTRAELDERLTAQTDRYHQAIDDGDLDRADEAYAELDRLLEARLHAPEQRNPR